MTDFKPSQGPNVSVSETESMLSPPESFGSPLKRRRSQSLSSCTDSLEVDKDLLPRKKKPPSFQDLDRLNDHTGLEDFGQSLQKAANAIFPANQTSRYNKVDVILLSWEEEDPKLPVSLEIQELADIFEFVYGYDVDRWLIPAKNCHNRLQGKILQFLAADEVNHLKIVYYGGHGRLTNHGQLAWTSFRDSHKDRCPTIRWSGIQSTLEESQSDVLILLDCCAAGVCTTDEGNGVTEMLAACAFNVIANGVGQFSFTHALNEKLRLLSTLPGFTIGYLYNAIFSYIQNWRLEDSRFKKPPVHLVLSQNPKLPPSIRLGKLSKARNDEHEEQFRKPSLPSGQGASNSSSVGLASMPSPAPSITLSSQAALNIDSTPETSLSPENQLPDWPRLLLSIRFSETVKPSELSTELFAEWLRSVPALANAVRVEAGFASDSTLMLVSIPAGLLAHLAFDRAINLIGTVRSRNLLVSHTEDVQRISTTTSSQDKVDTKASSQGKSGSDGRMKLSSASTVVSNPATIKPESRFLLPLAPPTYGGEDFREFEYRELIAGAMRASVIPIDKLYNFYQENATSEQPPWEDMLIPRGRTLKQCKDAFNSLQQASASRKRKPDSSTFDYPSPPLMKRRQIGLETIPVARDIRPKPPNGGSMVSSTPYTHLKKRGRPSKTEVERRNVETMAKGLVPPVQTVYASAFSSPMMSNTAPGLGSSSPQPTTQIYDAPPTGAKGKERRLSMDSNMTDITASEPPASVFSPASTENWDDIGNEGDEDGEQDSAMQDSGYGN
ncbi:uncharacterized protein LY89DRAFT_667987 [Mollisia scopiformis]|uniref:Uncharacterized protein n=1 Tax=Mollisia scopiformis TaxID=149040 RepID=A0A194XFK0_MOLSC|nr:uncharacterized protein LY89DRAFT_667987 [Mollisia scopiformis]KUJ18943.1 hypothetical protein LY89DRAFT_667987 [Mollisia scopiformis]